MDYQDYLDECCRLIRDSDWLARHGEAGYKLGYPPELMKLLHTCGISPVAYQASLGQQLAGRPEARLNLSRRQAEELLRFYRQSRRG